MTKLFGTGLLTPVAAVALGAGVPGLDSPGNG